MGNPIFRGTLSGTPFVNKHVDILHEDLLIKLDSSSLFAEVIVKYHINSSRKGTQIPFLFYASEFYGEFSVKFDGKEVSTRKCPYSYDQFPETEFNDFAYFFEDSSNVYDKNSYVIDSIRNYDFSINMEDMKYFEGDISVGKHIIEVTYKAYRWENRRNIMKEYNFRYALAPAKYWRSFGSLSLVVDARALDGDLSLNLGKPHVGTTDTIARWDFNSLPVDIVDISYVPNVSFLADLLLTIKPVRIGGIVIVLLLLIHLKLTSSYRQKSLNKRKNRIAIAGGILNPLFSVFAWIGAITLCSSALGQHAGHVGGLSLLYLGWYPLALSIYLLVFLLLNYVVKRAGY